MRIAAIDQGTTSTRVLVAGTGEPPTVVRTRRHRQSHPDGIRVEHDPEALIADIRACLDGLTGIDAIGLDNQGESCLAWEAGTGRPISPVIVWQDARTGPALEQLKADGAEQVTLARAGLPLDPYFSASKLRWLLDHAPEAKPLAAAGRLRLGTTDAFFLERLTGVCATDTTTASRTSLMNLATGAWDETLCGLFGVPMETLPEIRPTVGDFGSIGGVPVTAAVVDQQAALYGHGCRTLGDTKITFGTGAFVLAVTGPDIVRAPARGLLPTVAWDTPSGRSYAVDGGVYCAGAAVEWGQRLGLYAEVGDLAAFDQVPAIDRGIAFVPALSGLACPHWDRRAAGLWIGMGLNTDARDLTQSLLEGVALRTAEVVAAIAETVAVRAPISVDGGLTRSPYFLQFLADVLERSVQVPALDELTAFGTAQLAALGRGGTLSDGAPARRSFTPRPADVATWRARFAEAVTRCRTWR